MRVLLEVHYHCRSKFFCVKHIFTNMAALADSPRRTFPISHQVVRRDIHLEDCLPLQKLEEWATAQGITIGSLVPDDESWLKALWLVWTYYDIGVKELSKVPPTDLKQHQVCLKERTQPHFSKQRYFTGDKEW